MASVLGLVTAVCFATGALSFPDRHTWQSMLAGEEYRSDDFWVAAALRRSTTSSPILLPAEELDLRWTTLSNHSAIELRGSGIEETQVELRNLPASRKLDGGLPGETGSRRLLCGAGAEACRIDGEITLSNLTLTTGLADASLSGE